MKKFFSILFAAVILLSGMHFTVASHICGGELAAVKYSFTGEKATCGMENDNHAIPVNGEIQTNCCKNYVSSCTSDNTYFSSVHQFVDVQNVIAPDFVEAPITAIPTPDFARTYFSMVGPPVSYSSTSINQSFICVFII